MFQEFAPRNDRILLISIMLSFIFDLIRSKEGFRIRICRIAGDIGVLYRWRMLSPIPYTRFFRPVRDRFTLYIVGALRNKIPSVLRIFRPLRKWLTLYSVGFKTSRISSVQRIIRPWRNRLTLYIVRALRDRISSVLWIFRPIRDRFTLYSVGLRTTRIPFSLGILVAIPHGLELGFCLFSLFLFPAVVIRLVPQGLERGDTVVT